MSDFSRKMNKQIISVQSGSDESYSLPSGFSAEVNRKCNEFLDKRGLRERTFLHGFNCKRRSK